MKELNRKFFSVGLSFAIGFLIGSISLNNSQNKPENKTLENKNIKKVSHSENSKIEQDVWHDAPSLSILCRIYSGSAMEYYNVFVPSYLMFWPIKQWVNSDTILVLDDESESDHRMGTILGNMPPYPKVYYEKYRPNTFCSNWRSEG